MEAGSEPEESLLTYEGIALVLGSASYDPHGVKCAPWICRIVVP
jgi:hypothetical protein